MVMHSTVFGRPDPNAACLAGAWPNPAANTLPIITSFTDVGSSIVSSKIPPITLAPKSGPLTEEIDP